MTGIACPKCGNTKSYVVNSRDCVNGIKRRRECDKCGERFTTREFFAGANVRRDTLKELLPILSENLREAVTKSVNAVKE